MTPARQARTPRANSTVRVREDSPAPRDDATEDSALARQALIERAKSVLVVAWRIDEATAAQILFDAATQAGIPTHLAAGQVMTALQTGDDDEGITQHTLVHALETVWPVRPQWPVDG